MMTDQQKQMILEVVEQTSMGLFTASELIAKLEAITETNFETDAA